MARKEKAPVLAWIRDRKFHREAYLFVQEALAHAIQQRGQPGHVTGGELAEAVRALAIEQFGLMAKTVLNQWGVYSTHHIGELVFRLIEAQVFEKQDSDTLADFDDVYDFEQAFD